MSNVTIVCCYNNEKAYNDLVNSLKTQTCPYELIGIDNRDNKNFSACSKALNSVINQVKTKYVIYSHQDIILTTPDALAKFMNYLEKTGPDDILGVAGTKFEIPGTISNIRHGKNLTYAGSNRVVNGFMEGDTLDECFFAGHAKHFLEYPFDEIICDNWHLYAAEACLRTKSNYVQGGRACLYL